MGLLNNDIVRVTWRGLCFGQRIILTNDYLVIGDINPITTVIEDLANIATVIAVGGADDKTTRYMAALPPQYTLTDLRVQKLWPTRSAYWQNTFVGVVGTHASPATVANDSAALTMRTPFSGRKHRGTKHIGPIPDAASAAGLLTAGYRGIMATLGNMLLESIAPAGAAGFLKPGIYNKPLSSITFTLNWIIGDQSRVQRRRTVGIGE